MDKDKSSTCLFVCLYLTFNKSATRGNEGGGRAGVAKGKGGPPSRSQQFQTPGARCHYPHINHYIIMFD